MSAPQNTPIVNAPSMYINGMVIVYSPLLDQRIFGIGPGACRDSTNTNDIIFGTNLTVDINKIGPNGRDEEQALTPGAFYRVLVCADSNGYNEPCGLVSSVGSPVVLPQGYDLQRRIGWLALTNPSAYIEHWTTIDTGDQRWFLYDTLEFGSTIQPFAGQDLAGWRYCDVDAPYTQSRQVMLKVQFGPVVDVGAVIEFLPGSSEARSIAINDPSSRGLWALQAQHAGTAEGNLQVIATQFGLVCRLYFRVVKQARASINDCLDVPVSVAVAGFSDMIDERT